MSSNDMKIGIGLPANIPGVQGKQLIEWAKKADGGPFSSMILVAKSIFTLGISRIQAQNEHRL